MTSSTVRLVFLGDVSSAVRSVRTLEGAFGGLRRTAGLVGTAVGVAVVAGFAAATKAAIGFDRSMRSVNSLARLSEKDFAALEKRVLSLARTTGQGPRVLADGLYELVSSGLKANDAISVLNASAKAATAGMTDTQTATKAVVAVLNAYHLGAGKAREVSDVLFQVVNKGVVRFEELAQQMGDLVTPAAQMGVSIKDVGGAFAALTLQGGPAAERATQVKQLLVSMLKPSESLQGAFRDLGYESAQAALKQDGFVQVIGRLSGAAKGNQATIADWFPNVRALAGFMGLAGENTKRFEDIVRSMDGATKGAGATSRAFAEQAKSISVQWDIAKASLAAAAVPIGQLLFPALVKVTNAIGSLATFTVAHMPQIRAVFEAVTRGINSAWESHGRRAFDAMRSAISQTVAFVRQHWPEIRATIASVLTYLTQNVIPPFRSVLRSLGSITEDLAGIFRTAWPAIRLALVSAAIISAVQLRILAAAMRVLAGVVSALRPVIEGAFRAGAAAVSGAAGVIGGALAAIRGAIATFVDALRTAWDWLKKVASAISSVPAIKMPIGAITAFIGAVHSVKGAIDSLVGWIRGIPTDIKIGIRFIVGALPSIPTKTSVLERFKKRAGGGFIPGAAGAPVPILAHAGEMVLNRAQQDALGGAHTLARFFGFRGEEGPGFAAGGIVGARIPPAPSHLHDFKRTYSKLSELARAALRGVSSVNLAEQDATSRFGLVVREFNLTEEEPYTRTQSVPLVYGSSPTTILQQVPGQAPNAYKGPTTGFATHDPNIRPGDPVLNEFGEQEYRDVEVVDGRLVARRLKEIATLLRMRHHFLGLLDQEKDALEKAISALENALEELRAEIHKQREAAKAEKKHLDKITGELETKGKAVTLERGKKKPDKSRIKKLSAEIEKLKGDRVAIEERRAGHETKAKELGAIATQVTSDIGASRKNLGHELPFNRQEVVLDIAELRKERGRVLAVRSEIPPTEQIPAAPGDLAESPGGGGGEGGGAEGGFGGGETGAPPPPDQSALIEALRAEIGKLKLALGLETVQQAVLAAFAGGGGIPGLEGSPKLVLAHAGEVVLNRGQQASLGGPERIARAFGFQRFAAGGFVRGDDTRPAFFDDGGGGPPPPPPGGGPPSGTGGLPPPGFTINPGSLVGGGFGGADAPRLRTQAPVITDTSTRRGDQQVIVNVAPPQGARMNVNLVSRDEAFRSFLSDFVDVKIDESLPKFGRHLAKSADTARREGR